MRAAAAVGLALGIPGVVGLGWWSVDRHHRAEVELLQANVLLCQLKCHKGGAEYGAVSGANCECTGFVADMFERYCEDRAVPVNLAQ